MSKNASSNGLQRRTLLQGAAALVACASVPSARAATQADGADAALTGALDRCASAVLELAPEQATALGLDKGPLAGLKHRLADVSPAGLDRWTALMQSTRQQLTAIDGRALNDAEALLRDTVLYAVDQGLVGSKLRYGGGAAAGFGGGTSPYVLSQQNGAVTSVPEFLDAQHQIADAADAEAYLDRITAFATQLDQETERLRADVALGVIPPDFICATTIGQMRKLRDTPAAGQRLVASLAKRAQKAGIAGDWAARATQLVDRQVLPALGRQLDAFTQLTAKASSVAGVQRLPDGESYYRWALELGTSTKLSAQEIHRTGLEQNKALQSTMDALLKAQGLRNGSVGERMAALNKDPRFLYPDDDAGRAQLLGYLSDRLSALRGLMPTLSHMPLHAEVLVKRVPPDIQDGAALGYMNFAALDGSRPAIYYVNLKSTGLWPKFQLPTLSAHEGIPGHAWQGAYLAEHRDEVPLISSMMGFNAFTEGWALYAEQLADEHGLYADDPFGRLGQLQALQFRACRLVADTGLHAMRWSREQTVRFLVEQTGRGVAAMTSETDRYCASPGQACGYKVGHNEIVRLRAKAQAALGKRFDLAAFNDTVIQTRGVPLTLLARTVDRSIARQRKAA